ncbi:MAG TPA: hypothetical protein VNM22_01680 [Candidatus Limnocylindrales bacterium]|nr:hypothetical protein [Candidatus Limnocylindrales bacterium]
MATNYNPQGPEKENTNPAGSTGEAGNKQGSYIKKAQETMEEIKERVGEQVATVKDQVEEQMVKIKDRVEETYEAGKVKVGEMVEGVKKNLPEIRDWSLEKIYNDSIAYVKANPDKGLLISLVAGFVLGLIFRRKQT